ncbi:MULTISPECIES: dephospho-CoA kinase [Pseudonocardia]|uniref:Dephospho-CoA kinase n=2 Tax=Pseudonocardia TaxID=1847 RepID=A0A1Y2MSS1_PSEAH|nr:MULTISPECIES: dephospho-CoA kinase [Pseudonocardia]OSY38264.1 Dephospho-CoA kinase [Pseudonocardia autotrophica]TDN71010.1 dephospho-CoA kinase [Pseudonocardia autotrophica]BBG01678.1 dephospho-CoA kinase [Pseudonocardia autotrophica]GEC25423.1 dephospho-CoA kinase [Pseudonocardia saturnea]
MLRTGLTGGIGAGKSTVARRLVERGAVLVDSDLLAREVVAAGTEGLAAIVAAFGDGVLRPDGELDRPALASIVFGDAEARGVLDGIVHPLVRARSDELVAAAAPDAIVVQDVPLLVEGGMAAAFPLVVVVGVDAEERIRRLVSARGMSEQDARARIAAQATDEGRRAAADVWLDNSGAEDDTRRRVDALWDGRLLGFEENLRLGRPVPDGPPLLVEADPDWPEQARRLAERIGRAAGERGRGVEHVGATAVPGLPARDVLDLQLAVESRSDAAALGDRLAVAGFPEDPGAAPDGAGTVRVHRSADPGRPAVVVVRVHGSAAWRHALGMRDRLRADPRSRDGYTERRRAAAALYGADPDSRRYTAHTAAWRDDPDE